MKNRINIKRGIALLLTASMVLSVTACSASTEESSAAQDEELLTETAMSMLTKGANSAERGKEETVYVLSGADGSAEQIICNVHLKNGEGSDELTDACNLTDIENTRGSESYTAHDDGTIVWKAGGSDIYYRGNSEEELPLAVSISYTLDGKQVTPEELAGQSGHVTITFTYDNRLSKEVVINGENVKIAKPCAVVSGLLLDNEKCQDVTVTNGKSISAGDNLVAVGLAMPGLQESLGIEDLENVDTGNLENLLPDSVTIEADVVDFSLSMTVTLVSWDIMDSIDITGLKDTVDDANNSAADLQDGTNELISGAQELSDYLRQLSDGASELSDGAKSLADGAASAKEGSDQLAAGLVKMQAQVSALPDGTAKLLAGAQALSTALQSGSTDNIGVYEALLAIQDGANSIVSGTSGIMSGAEQISAGATSIAGGADAIAAGTSAISAGAVSGDLSNPGIYETAGMVKSGLGAAAGTLSESLGTAAEGLQRSVAANQTAQSTLSAMDTTGMTAEQITAVQTAIAYMQGAESADSQVLAGLGSASFDLTDANTALDGIMAGAQRIAGGAKSGDAAKPGIYEAAVSIKSGAQSIAAGAKSDDTKNPGIYEAAAAINTGASALAESAGTLADAVATMNNDENLGALIAGLQELCDSSSTLISGVNQLVSGTGSLSTGLGTLSSGADSLASGAASADEAAERLTDGSLTLLDGINTLNDEGISKIVSLLDGDVNTLYDRLDALKSYGEEPVSCSGTQDGVSCSTVYIYKTTGIGD